MYFKSFVVQVRKAFNAHPTTRTEAKCVAVRTTCCLKMERMIFWGQPVLWSQREVLVRTDAHQRLQAHWMGSGSDTEHMGILEKYNHSLKQDNTEIFMISWRCPGVRGTKGYSRACRCIEVYLLPQGIEQPEGVHGVGVNEAQVHSKAVKRSCQREQERQPSLPTDDVEIMRTLKRG